MPIQCKPVKPISIPIKRFMNMAIPVVNVKNTKANTIDKRDFPHTILLPLIAVDKIDSKVFFSRSPARLSARSGIKNVIVKNPAKDIHVAISLMKKGTPPPVNKAVRK